MGFFQELKEDLSQAVNELVPEEEMVSEDAANEETVNLDEESIFAAAEESMGIEHHSSVEDMIAASEEMDISMEQLQSEMPPVITGEELMQNEVEEVIPVHSRTQAPPIPEPEKVPTSAEATDEIATITKNMTINGDVVSNGSLDLIGAVHGNVHILGKLNITGTLVGKTEAAEVYAQEAQIVGDIICSGSVKIGQDTVIRGNIIASSAVVAGAVKGDFDVRGPVILDSTAIVMGNIKSKAVQINNGAAIEGLCSQSYAEVSPSSFFKD